MAYFKVFIIINIFTALKVDIIWFISFFEAIS